MKIGFTIGKFAPLHKGHQYLIEKALQEMDKFYVIIYETKVTKISLETRASWIQKIYPEVNIIYAKNPPSTYGLDEKSVKIQTDYLKEKVKISQLLKQYLKESLFERFLYIVILNFFVLLFFVYNHLASDYNN